jgi:hypothetical protein
VSLLALCPLPPPNAEPFLKATEESVANGFGARAPSRAVIGFMASTAAVAQTEERGRRRAMVPRVRE